jgi:outer membrane protein assembly factor BamB
MKRVSLLFVFLVALATITGAANWPNWRNGADGSGVTSETNLPLNWSATEHVAWKVALPERGNSTPVIWGDKIFLTQALEKEKKRTLMCLAKTDGKLLWKQEVVFDKAEETHPTNPYCSASPTTDGERVIVCHGSAGVFCYDFDGKEQWRRDLGPQEYEWGNASSPVIHGDRVFLYFGPGKGARLLALDKRTGKDLWRYDESETDSKGRTDGFRGNEPGMICTYATPIIVQAGEREEVVMLFPRYIRAFDPATGKELWHCDGMNPLIYCSPIAGEGTIVGMGGFFGTTVAVRPGGSGDQTAQRLWQTVRTKNRLGSGIIHEGHIYILNTDGNAECIELKTGKTVYLQRLKAVGPNGESWSSMVRSGDRIYILNQSGDCFVLRASPKFELLATNSLGNELTNASLAVSDGRLFIRTHKNLWCIQ